MKQLALATVLVIACSLLAAPLAAKTTVTGFDASQLEALQILGLETPTWMLGTTQLRPVPTQHPDFPLTCSDYNSSWCTFQWDGGCCCVAAWSAPGAYCGSICV
ncbi:MAG: hypothetical protein AAGC60_00490 [Acidobacteriota bacterium]